MTLPPRVRVEVPTAVAGYPEPVFPVPPPAIVARSLLLVHHIVMPRGGHFPFHEAPNR